MKSDVVIVGAGPSGLTIACELALAGQQVVVLERRAEGVQSRAGTILPRVLELFDYRDLAQTFIDRAREIRDNPLIQFHIWAGLQPVHWSNIESPFGYRLVLPQSETEEILKSVALAAGVRILSGHTVVQLDESADGAAVVAELGDGSRARFEAQYIVGADGARSAIRTLSGIPFEGHDGSFTGIIADVPVNMHWPEGRATVENEHGWAASFPFSPGGDVTRFNMVHAERRHADKSEPVTAAEVKEALKDIFQRDIEFDELVWASRFTDAMRVVPTVRKGRVLLVGESVRIHYPASGVGMNFCIQDAFNLGWKLGYVLRGWAPDSILDSYEEERLPVVHQLLESVRAQCAIQFNFSSEGLALKRLIREEILPIPEVNRLVGLQLNGLRDPYPTALGTHPVVGLRVPELTLQTPHGLERLAAWLRGGRFLIVDLTGEDRFAGLASSGVDAVSGVPSLRPAILDSVTSMLVRPDGYVHWVSTSADGQVAEARNALSTWLVKA